MRRRAAIRPSPRAQATRLTLALAFLAGAGCTSPAAVKRYSASAALVTAKLPDASAALSASCRRTQSYRLRRTTVAWYGSDSLALACAGRDSALRDVGRANRVLAAYLKELGILAGGKPGEMDASLAALGGAAADAGHFERAQVDAISALAKFAAARGTRGYRRAKLREAIAGQNANVQAVTTVLHEILDRDFARYLRDDETAQTAFYRAALAENGTREPLGAILIRDSYDDRQAELTQRADAIQALGRALDLVGRGHQQLYDARNHLGAKELLAFIVTNARELDAAIAKVDQAF
jgi:hypothetical protein